jgi:hypothetical protein
MAGVAEVPRAYDGHRCHLAALMHYKDVSEREAEPIHTRNGDYSIREAMASAHQAAVVSGHKALNRQVLEAQGRRDFYGRGSHSATLRCRTRTRN